MKVAWLQHGFPIDTTNGRYVVEEDNTLRIDGVVGTDTGEYTCAAETDYDRTERTAKIVVKGNNFLFERIFSSTFFFQTFRHLLNRYRFNVGINLLRSIFITWKCLPKLRRKNFGLNTTWTPPRNRRIGKRIRYRSRSWTKVVAAFESVCIRTAVFRFGYLRGMT